MKIWRCERCEHEWAGRKKGGVEDAGPPVKCPRCGSPYWNRPRVKEVSNKDAVNPETAEEEVDVIRELMGQREEAPEGWVRADDVAKETGHPVEKIVERGRLDGAKARPKKLGDGMWAFTRGWVVERMKKAEARG